MCVTIDCIHTQDKIYAPPTYSGILYTYIHTIIECVHKDVHIVMISIFEKPRNYNLIRISIQKCFDNVPWHNQNNHAWGKEEGKRQELS
jgi:hypothetical protein